MRGGHAIPVIIQPDLADGDDFRVLRQVAQRAHLLRVEVSAIVRVHPDGCIDAGIAFGQRHDLAARRYRDPGTDDPLDACFDGPFDHGLAVGVELRHVEVAVRVYHFTVASPQPSPGGRGSQMPASFRPSCRIACTLSPCVVSVYTRISGSVPENLTNSHPPSSMSNL